MATFQLYDFIHDDTGAPVSGINVQAFAKNTDGSETAVGAVTTTDVNGRWAFSFDTAVIDGLTALWNGYMRIKITNPASSKMRVREGDIAIQAAAFLGNRGTIPVADGSLSVDKIQSGGSAATWASKLTLATTDQTLVSPANTGSITQKISWFAKVIKDFKGTTNWFTDLPVWSGTSTKITLNDLQRYLVRTGADNAIALHSRTSIPVGTDGDLNDLAIVSGTNAGAYRKTTTSLWTKVADLGSGGGGGANSFGTINSGGTSVTPATDGQTFSLVAGSGISITGNNTSKQATIAATGGGGGSVTGGSVGSGSNTSIPNPTTLSVLTTGSLSAGTYIVTGMCSLSFLSGGDGGNVTMTLNAGGSLQSGSIIAANDSGASVSHIYPMSHTWYVVMGSSGTFDLRIGNLNAFTVVAMSPRITYMKIA